MKRKFPFVPAADLLNLSFHEWLYAMTMCEGEQDVLSKELKARASIWFDDLEMKPGGLEELKEKVDTWFAIEELRELEGCYSARRWCPRVQERHGLSDDYIDLSFDEWLYAMVKPELIDRQFGRRWRENANRWYDAVLLNPEVLSDLKKKAFEVLSIADLEVCYSAERGWLTVKQRYELSERNIDLSFGEWLYAMFECEVGKDNTLSGKKGAAEWYNKREEVLSL